MSELKNLIDLFSEQYVNAVATAIFFKMYPAAITIDRDTFYKIQDFLICRSVGDIKTEPDIAKLAAEWIAYEFGEPEDL